MGMTKKDVQWQLTRIYRLNSKKDFSLYEDSTFALIVLNDGPSFSAPTWTEAFDQFKKWYEEIT